MGGGWRVGGVIFMSLLYYMFQIILNTFAFGYFFGVKKLIIFTDGAWLWLSSELLELHKQCIEQDLLVLKLLGPLVREALGKLRYQVLASYKA